MTKAEWLKKREELERNRGRALHESLADPKDEILAVFGGKAPDVEDPEASVKLKAAFTTESGYKEPFESKESIDESDAEEIIEAFGGSPLLTEAMEEAEFGPLLLETISIDSIQESPGQPFTFRGKAVRVDRKNKNRRRYRRGITEKALAESQGKTLTIMDGHPRRGDTAVTPVIGKVEFGSIGEDGWMPYQGTISNTSRGTDVQQLLRDKCIGDVSLRARGRTSTAKMEDGEFVEDVVDLHFRGLDLVTEGSEQGSGVTDILSAAMEA